MNKWFVQNVNPSTPQIDQVIRKVVQRAKLLEWMILIDDSLDGSNITTIAICMEYGVPYAVIGVDDPLLILHFLTPMQDRVIGFMQDDLINMATGRLLRPILYTPFGHMVVTQVVNVLHSDMDDPNLIYIGRPQKTGHHKIVNGGFWGNIFNKKDPDVGSKEVAIALYREWIIEQPEKLAQLHTLRGKKLGCWCKKNGYGACHGDVLKELIGY